MTLPFNHRYRKKSCFYFYKVRLVGNDCFYVLVCTGGFLHVILIADRVNDAQGIQSFHFLFQVEVTDGSST